MYRVCLYTAPRDQISCRRSSTSGSDGDFEFGLLENLRRIVIFIQVLSYFSRIDRYPLIVPLPLLDSHSPFLFLLLFFFFFFSPPLSAPLSPAPLSKVPPPLNAAIIPYLSIM